MSYLFKSFLILLILAAPATPALAGNVSLSVAASMKDVFNDLSAAFVAKHPGTRFLRNYGASGALAKQIESGAPADIYISANEKWMDYLQEKKLLKVSSRETFAYNRLVFAALPGKAASMQDLKRLEKIAIGSPQSVPAGEYAMEALKKAGLDKALAGKLVMARDVRECLMYAERGEVDGAFVYKTDALLAKQVKILFTVPQELATRVTYPMALTRAGAENREAAAFFAWLHGDDANTVLTRYGYSVR